MHVREQIRVRVVSLLSGLPTTGDRVFGSAVHPLTPQTMPGLTIWCRDDKPTDGTLRATTMEMALRVGVYAEGDDPATVHQVFAEVEAALYGDRANGRVINGLATNLMKEGSNVNYIDNAAVRHTKGELAFAAEYQTEDGDAETAT